jgi:hypothetical protein
MVLSVIFYSEALDWEPFVLGQYNLVHLQKLRLKYEKYDCTGS